LAPLRNFASVLREISFDEVRDEAETLPRLLIIAPTVAVARQLGAALVGPEGELAVTARDLVSPLPDLAPFDGAVVLDPDRTGVTTRLRDRAASAGSRFPWSASRGAPPATRPPSSGREPGWSSALLAGHRPSVAPFPPSGPPRRRW
jgi:hypothetical protein